MSKEVTRRRLSRPGKAALVTASAAALALGLPGSASAAVLNPLPESTTSFQKTFRPYFDYDSDSCFPAAAININGALNGGLQDTGSITGGCRSNHLGKANTYSRAKCNNGWCGIVYTLYFEKDQNAPGNVVGGHRHDWEAAVLWVKQGDSSPSYASVSAHGQYTTRPFNQVERSGNRLKVVYHKEGAGTHSFRFAKAGERAEAWGGGGWDQPALVSWNSFPRGAGGVDLQAKLNNASWGNANFPLKDGRYNIELSRAKPSNIPFNPNA